MTGMSPDEFAARLTHLLDQEEGNEEEWHWLSFADPKLPQGTQFLGVAIVKAKGFMHAVTRAHDLGVNPGGEVAGYPCPPDWEPPEGIVDRLLSTEELEKEDLI